jgi:hypothetical protein
MLGFRGECDTTEPRRQAKFPLLSIFHNFIIYQTSADKNILIICKNTLIK